MSHRGSWKTEAANADKCGITIGFQFSAFSFQFLITSLFYAAFSKIAIAVAEVGETAGTVVSSGAAQNFVEAKGEVKARGGTALLFDLRTRAWLRWHNPPTTPPGQRRGADESSACCWYSCASLWSRAFSRPFRATARQEPQRAEAPHLRPPGRHSPMRCFCGGGPRGLGGGHRCRR